MNQPATLIDLCVEFVGINLAALPATHVFMLPIELKEHMLSFLNRKNLLTEARLRLLVDECLRALDMSGCRQTANTTVVRVAKCCPNLRTLNLANCPLISDFTILEIASNCTQLTSVNLSHCTNISDNSILALLKQCALISNLELSHCTFTGSFFITIENEHKQLQEHQKHQQPAFMTTDRFSPSQHQYVGLPRLVNIDLSGCFKLDREAVLSLFRLAPNLETVSLNNILPQQLNVLLDKLGAGCHNLKSISMRMDEHTRIVVPFDASLNSIILSKSAMHLHSLDFSGCTFADDRQFKSFIKSCFNLKHLVLSHSGGMGEEKIFLLAQNLSKLEVLGLSDCNGINDRCIEILCTSLISPSLEVLNVSRCKALTDKSVEYIMLSKNVTNLKKLIMSGCSLSSPLFEGHPSLTHLNVSHHARFLNAHFSLPRLSELILSNVSILHSPHISCSMLTSLQLVNCERLIDPVISCPALNILDITRETNLVKIKNRGQFDNGVVNSRTVNNGNGQTNSDNCNLLSLKDCSIECPSLSTLIISNYNFEQHDDLQNPDISNDFLRKLFIGIGHNLKNINLKGTKGIPLEIISQTCKKLISLNLSSFLPSIPQTNSRFPSLFPFQPPRDLSAPVILPASYSPSSPSKPPYEADKRSNSFYSLSNSFGSIEEFLCSQALMTIVQQNFLNAEKDASMFIESLVMRNLLEENQNNLHISSSVLKTLDCAESRFVSFVLLECPKLQTANLSHCGRLERVELHHTTSELCNLQLQNCGSLKSLVISSAEDVLELKILNLAHCHDLREIIFQQQTPTNNKTEQQDEANEAQKWDNKDRLLKCLTFSSEESLDESMDVQSGEFDIFPSSRDNSGETEIRLGLLPCVEDGYDDHRRNTVICNLMSNSTSAVLRADEASALHHIKDGSGGADDANAKTSTTTTTKSDSSSNGAGPMQGPINPMLCSLNNQTLLLHNLRALDVSYCIKLSKQAIHSLVYASRDTLQELYLGGCDFLDDDDVSTILSVARNLQVIDLNECQQLTNAVFEYLMANREDLEVQRINVTWNKGMTEMVRSKLRQLMPSLHMQIHYKNANSTNPMERAKHSQ